MELECGYSPQDWTIAILSFLAPLYQPRPRLLLENQPWEEHCSETLLRSSPIVQTPADYKLLHIHTHTHIYKDICLLLSCFSCSHTVLPKEHSPGVIFFLLTFLMLCCIFLQFPVFLSCLPPCHICMLCMDRLMAHFTSNYTLYNLLCDK